MALSPREAEVLALVGERHSNAEIARSLFISVRTVETHVSALLRKLQIADRRGLIAHARGAAPPAAIADDPLIGRDAELAELRRSTAAPGLVTIVGPGGVGKTRLARAVAPDKSRFVDLTALPTGAGADLVAAAAARAVGAVEGIGRGPLDDLVAAVRIDSALVVFDNCEHVLDGAAAVAAELLRRAPARLLATGRERLGIAGEREFALEPLAMTDAVELFRRAGGEWATDSDPDVVATVCARLDGLPLAVELAAARLRVLGISDLLDSLASGVDVLDGGDRSRPRQRSVRRMLSWSLDLLSAEDRQVHRRLSVLPGPFRIGAAEAVVGQPASGSIARLVDASLLVRHGADRYRQLDLVRTDAAERLDLADERALAEQGLLTWAEDVLPDAQPQDAADLRAAALVAAQRRRPELLLRLGEYWTEQRSYADAADAWEKAAALSADPATAIRAAELHWSRWRGAAAVQAFLLAAELAHERANGSAEIRALVGCIEINTRFVATVAEPLDAAALDDLLDRARAVPPTAELSDMCQLDIGAAWTLISHGDDVAAAEAAQRAVASAALTSDAVLESAALDALAGTTTCVDDVGTLAAVSERRLDLAPRLAGSPRAEMELIDVHNMAADGPCFIGRFVLARQRAEHVLALETERGIPATGWGRLAVPEFFLGEWDACLDHAASIVDTWQAEGRPTSGWLAPAIAVAAAIAGYRADPAAAYWDDVYSQITSTRGAHNPLRLALTADVHLFHGRREAAAAAVATPSADLRGMWRSLYAATRAEVLGGAAAGDAERFLYGNRYGAGLLARARGDLSGALAIFEECGAGFQAARTRLLIDAGDGAASAVLSRLGVPARSA